MNLAVLRMVLGRIFLIMVNTISMSMKSFTRLTLISVGIADTSLWLRSHKPRESISPTGHTELE